MTEKLRTLMDERATEPDFAVPDLAAVRAAGLRRRRRRQTVVGGAGLAATASVAVLAVLLVGLPRDADTGPDVAKDSAPTSGPTAFAYALGDVIHDGGGEITVDHPVRAFVQTSVGYVTVDDRGKVWSVVDAREQYVGTVDRDDPRLVSDPEGSQVAWFDVEEKAVVVHDQADGTGTTYDIELETTQPGWRLTPGYVYALSAGALYVRDGADAVSIDLTTRERTVVYPHVKRGYDLVDAADGEALFETGTQEGRLVSVGPTRAEAGQPIPVSGSGLALSPDASFVAVLRDDEGAVFETRTGRRIDLDLDGFYEAYGWSDPATLLVIAGTGPDGSGAGRLVACDVRAGSCEAGVPDIGTLLEVAGELVLPTGTL